jgi:sodium transport system ATP-binding protein
MIQVRGLSKAFGKQRQIKAVSDVSFGCEDGVVSGLLGPNGSGKTTLLRMIAGLMIPDSGEVLIDGISALREPRKARAKVGLQSDMRGTYTWLTPREQFTYFGQLYGLSGAALRQRVASVIDDLNMGDIADRYTHGFSLGQRQKVILGRALIHNPRNVIFDEPTNGLDLLAVREVREHILKLKREGSCILFSTHYMSEAERLCDTAHIIVAGKIVTSGSPAELTARAGKSSFEDAAMAFASRTEMVVLAATATANES